MIQADLQDQKDDNEDAVDELVLVVPFLRQCWGLLRECRFREFWKVWNEEESEGAESESRNVQSCYALQRESV